MDTKDSRIPFTIGDQIKAARKSQNITQQELADRIGISRAQLGQWETKSRNPRMKNLSKIASALGMDTEDLIHYLDSKTPMEQLQEELQRDPVGFKINAINLLLQGLSDEGLKKALSYIARLIEEGGENVRQ